MIELVVNYNRHSGQAADFPDQVLHPAVMLRVLLTARAKLFEIINRVIFGFFQFAHIIPTP